MEKRKKLMKLINETKQPLIAPGVFDCIGAKVTENVGFQLCIVTGNGVSASLIGKPDVGLISYKEVLDTASNIANAVNIPVIADADTGYGGVLNVIRTVEDMKREGLSGLFIEDQMYPKKCSYIGENSLLESKEEFVAKIKAARWAIGEDDFLLIARTDALVSGNLREALDRANAYGQAGADLIFFVGIKNKEDLKYIVDKVRYSIMININEGEALSDMSYDEFVEIGVKLIMYPNIVRGSYVSSLVKSLNHLKKKGNTNGYNTNILKSSEFNKLMDLDNINKIEKGFY